MRLICPHCMSGVTVSDDTAGREAVCPNCGKSFPTPPRYTPTVAPDAAVAGSIEPVRTSPHPEPPVPPPPPSAPTPPTPPPGFVPPGPLPPAAVGTGFLPTAPTAPAVVPAPTLEGYTRSFGLTISPHIVSWLPAVLLLFTLVFTCFPWVGSYAGGSAVYSQRPWGAMFGSVSRNFALEKSVAIPAGWLDKVRSDWELMVPYLLFLVVVMALAWADRGLRALDPRRVPPLAKVWPHRQAVILGLATFIFILSVIQVANGFGMERAIRKQVAEDFAAKREQAANSPADQARLDWEVEQTYAKYNLERTSWMYLALLCNFLAILAVVARIILDRRGNKPPPKLLLHY